MEIAVVACAFRPGAKSSRLIELIHRAIPYPVLLLTTDAEGLTVSVAHKRQAQNEAGKIVIERVVASPALALRSDAPHERAFLDSLALPSQRRDNLWSLYRGWLARVEALNAARIGGTYAPTDDEKVDRRRAALAAHTRRALKGKSRCSIQGQEANATEPSRGAQYQNQSIPDCRVR